MSTPKRRRQGKDFHGWAWEIKETRGLGGIWTGRWTLCYWAQSDKAKLMAKGKPSPEARAVRVKFVRKP